LVGTDTIQYPIWSFFDVPVMDGQYAILMDSIVAYALRNPNKGIDITGFFSTTENRRMDHLIWA
jgi:hypothetical protein